MSFNNYGELCTEVYNLTKKIGQSFGGDIEFYRSRLIGSKGRSLEVMVGSGRVLIPLLEAGISIDGMDASAEMLAACKASLSERGLSAKLYCGHLQQLELPLKYENIIIPSGSFLLIEKRDESLTALRAMFNHLVEGGTLLFDIFLPTENFEAGKAIRTMTVNCPNDNLITMEEKLVEVNFLDQYKVSYLKYEKWRKGSLIQTELQRFAIRWYGIEEMKLILKDVGFSQVKVIADFECGKEPTHARQNFVFEAIK